MVAVLKRLEKQPRVTLVAFSPPIFTGSASVLSFCVSLPPPRENASRGIYIGLLDQAERSRAKTNDIRGSRAKRSWVARIGMGHVPPMLFWALVAHSRVSSS
jgi:hypothetical protein